jgi:hypothetical protein
LVPASIGPPPDQTVRDARQRGGGHADAGLSVLARSAIASYTRPTSIEFPIISYRDRTTTGDQEQMLADAFSFLLWQMGIPEFQPSR